jgi:hypothetical protein
MFRTKVAEKFESHILYSVTFFSNIMPSMKFFEKKNTVERGRLHDNLAHLYRVLDAQV